MSKEMLNAFAMLEEQKGIKSEIVIEAIEQAITAAYKRQYGQAQNVKVIFDEKKTSMFIRLVKSWMKFSIVVLKFHLRMRMN